MVRDMLIWIKNSLLLNLHDKYFHKVNEQNMQIQNFN